MSVDLGPDRQKLIDAAIRSGAYSNAGQVIGRALEALSAALQERKAVFFNKNRAIVFRRKPMRMSRISGAT